MSYSILYNWQFLKSTEGITPVILIGDNNVTTRVWMGNHWGERRAREWSCLFNFIGVSEEKFMNEIMNMTGKAYQEHWVRNGKWVDDNALVKWAKKACETAADVEEIFKLNPFVYVHAYLSVWDKEDKNTHVQEAFIKDSASLDEWIRSAKKTTDEQRAAGNTVYPIIKYSREDLKKCNGEKKSHPESVLVKSRYGYLTSYALDKEGKFIEKSSWSRNVHEAAKYSFDEASSIQRKGVCQGLVNMRLIDVKAQDAPYDAVIKAVSKKSASLQYFVRSVGTHKVYFTFQEEYAKHYRDVRSAEQTAKKLNEKSSEYDYQAMQITKKS